MIETTLPVEAAIRKYLEEYAFLSKDILCPEIELYNTLKLSDFWQVVQTCYGTIHAELPFWAIVWPGGRALARYILDRQSAFMGKQVLDLACGSGITSIALSLSGATVTAVDKDPAAVVLGRMHAAHNGAAVTFRCLDVLHSDAASTAAWDYSRFDTVVAADIFYDEQIGRAFSTFASKYLPHCRILVSDPMRLHRPKLGWHVLEKYRVPVYPEVEGIRFRECEILELH